MQDHLKNALQALGVNVARPDLTETPKLWEDALRELLAGEGKEPTIAAEDLMPAADGRMVIVKDIAFTSVCAHHVLPFQGKAHIAYVPDQTIIGLGKIPKIIDHLARRLQMQETLTVQIADAFEKILRPKGVGVVIEASHQCMIARGAKAAGTSVMTTELRGRIRDDAAMHREFLTLVQAAV